MLTALLYLLLGLSWSKEITVELTEFKPNRCSSSMASSDSESSDFDFDLDFELIDRDEDVPGLEMLTDDIIERIFARHLDNVSMLNFYKTCKRYRRLLIRHLDQSSFIYRNHIPVLKIFDLFTEFEDENVEQGRKDAIKALLMTNIGVRKYQELIFSDGKTEFDLAHLGLSRAEKFSLIITMDCTINLLLSRKVDPEIVAILVKRFFEKMLQNFDSEAAIHLIKNHGHVKRAKPLLDSLFHHKRIEVLKTVDTDDDDPDEHLMYSMNSDQIGQVLDYGIICEPYSNYALCELIQICCRSKKNLKKLLSLVPHKSAILTLGAILYMRKSGASVVEIRKICRSFYNTYVFSPPTKDISDLLKLLAEDEDFVLQILKYLNSRMILAFWDKSLDGLVTKLGYSENFRKSVRSTMRYK